MNPQLATTCLLLMSAVPALAEDQGPADRSRDQCLTEADAKALAGALQEEHVRVRCLEWDGEKVLLEALASRDQRHELGRAFERGAVRPGLVWCLDAAVVRYAHRLNKSEPGSDPLHRGIATPVFCMLSQDAASGLCSGFVALGELMTRSDGEYAEGLDELLFQLFRGSPSQVVECWPRLASYQQAIGLETTAFCSERRQVLAKYPGNGGAARFLRKKASACRGS